MLEIRFTAGKPNDLWLEIASQLNAEIAPNGDILIPPELGSGYMKAIPIEPGLLITIMEMEMRTNMNIRRIPSTESTHYPIFYYHSRDAVEQIVENRSSLLAQSTPHGIFFPSPHIETIIKIPGRLKVECLVIGMAAEWLLEKLDIELDSNLFQNIQKQNPFFIYESIDLNIKNAIETLIENFSKITGQMFVMAKSYELIGLFLEKIRSRSNAARIRSFDSRDVSLVFKVKEAIDENLALFPSISYLAKNIGMSESNMQLKFKLVFGKTMYQYHLEQKLEEAARLIRSRKLSVTETGIFLGYSNLSRFTDAFKRHFGMTPSKYREEVLR